MNDVIFMLKQKNVSIFLKNTEGYIVSGYDLSFLGE